MRLRFYPIELQLAHRWTVAGTSISSGKKASHVVIVELEGESSSRGLGESAPSRRYQESVESSVGFLSKVDPGFLSFRDVEGSMRYVESLGSGEFSAKAALNIALLDGAARISGKALCDLLGLGFRENHHITSFSIGIDRPEIIRTKVLAADRYPVLKLKVAGPDDQANLAALREVAPNKWVRVDANEGWTTKEEALRNIEWLAQDGRIQFVEQPMPATTPVRDWRWLKARSPLPLFADESYRTAGDVATAVECFHGVNVKLGKTGGVTNTIGALEAARAAGLKTMIGCMIETSILISAASHLAELCDYLDVDGNLLTTNDPFAGVTAEAGLLSFNEANEEFGLRVSPRH